jgi:hypothetical protein
MKTSFALCLLAVACFAGSGCISTERTTYRDAERVKVAFENEAAGRMFYEALSKKEGNAKRSESTTEISLPIVFEHKQHTVDGDNLVFNAAVRRCDSNGDGTITELEARIYLASVSK